MQMKDQDSSSNLVPSSRQLERIQEEEDTFDSRYQDDHSGSIQVNFELDPHVQEEGNIKELQCVRQSKSAQFAYVFLSILTLGGFYLAMKWRTDWKLKFLYQKVPVDLAKYVVVFGPDEDIQIEEIKTITQNENNSNNNHSNSLKTFSYRYYKYFWNESLLLFQPLGDNIDKFTYKHLLSYSQTGLTANAVSDSIHKNGPNATTIISRGVFEILIEEVLSPFYIFQFCSVCLWMVDDYEIYAFVILFTSLLSMVISVYESKANFRKLHSLTQQTGNAQVIRNNATIDIPMEELAVGDVIILSQENFKNKNNSATMSCDALIIQGSAIINEAMLTGESIPVLKSAVLPTKLEIQENALFEENKENVIYSGSDILQAQDVRCVVIRTGFSTLKGSLIRSVMYPPKSNALLFQADSVKFILILASFAIICFCISLPGFIDKIRQESMSVQYVIKKLLDLITITVPPALPTAISFGISFAISRLSQQQIFCLHPNKINVCGKVRTMCFDKTGTLTESGMAIEELKMCNAKQFLKQPIENSSDWEGRNSLINLRNSARLNQDQSAGQNNNNAGASGIQIQRLIAASCHDIVIHDGSLLADPLDLEMFQLSGYTLINDKTVKLLKNSNKNSNRNSANNNSLDNNNNSNRNSHGIYSSSNGSSAIAQIQSEDEIEILKKFQFKSESQMMTVVVRHQGQLLVFSKGSPEKITQICDPASLPDDLSIWLNGYGQQGFRILAIGYKSIASYSHQDDDRTIFEQNLTFAGLIIFENKLKQHTIEQISLLKNSLIRVIMVTGDNPLTAQQVAKNCCIIKPLSPPAILDYVNNQPTFNGQIIQIKKIIQDQEIEEEEKQQISVDGGKKPVENQSQQVQLLEGTEDPELAQILIAVELNISSFTMTGNFYERFIRHNSNTAQVNALLQETSVFARMKPDQKQHLVMQLQKQPDNYEGRDSTLVGMCGDGANDCGALKQADMGVSLSESEQSIAGSLSSKICDIRCIGVILREGRCSLVTCFECFKYMALYSMIQCVTTTILYVSSSIPSSEQFLYWDLVLILPLAFMLGLTPPTQELTVQTPTDKLISPTVLISVVGQIIIQIAFQVSSVILLSNESWYVSTTEIYASHPVDSFADQQGFESTTLFWITNIQYIAVVISFTMSSQFKKPFYTNNYFVVLFIIDLILSSFLIFTDNEHILRFFDLIVEVEKDGKTSGQLPFEWRIFIAALCVLNMAMTLLFEKYIVDFLANIISAMFKRQQAKIKRQAAGNGIASIENGNSPSFYKKKDKEADQVQAKQESTMIL